MTLTNKILISLLLGIFLGSFINFFIPDTIKLFISSVDVLGSLFISSLKMLIVPVVFFSIVSGVTNLEDTASLGRIGGKSIFLYLFSTFIAITLALLFANLIDPGSNANFSIENNIEIKSPPPISNVIESLIPKNPLKALSEGNMLQIIIFAILVGITITKLDKTRKSKLKDAFISFNDLFLKMIDVIMFFAPYGVFFLILKTFMSQGFGAITELASYFFTVLIVLFIHFFITYSALLLIFTKVKIKYFYGKMKKTILFAFSTASSAATIPVTLKTVEEDLGVNKSVASFSVPLGATINMDGTAIMQGVATVFIANAYGVDLNISDFISVIMVATLASVGTAGVPGVGLIMLAMVLNQVGLPSEGIALIIGIDRLLDMTRTAVNVTGDAAISCVVASTEKNKLKNTN
ncbi:MAG: dicarboxylate/amino acid:cation symporter [Rickettsiales bacterium]|nr:dicarboxylate/amino acid:cation symporter [Rickettsiales bacterium]OUV78981.1 MAG: dicarboxylate/amino acid:cation symporter [Rickettsiales bacterium TMED131]|tara:strand:- start:5 stop:1225 length:1221 start_codon:yes stop_codon:yes gene_type:complete